MRKVLITGATGGLGRRACELLTAEGVDVLATGRDVQKGAVLRDRGIAFAPLDLAAASMAELVPLLEGVTSIWHCAALSSPWGDLKAFEQANVLATRQLAQAAVQAGVGRFVHISTPALYFDFTHRLNVRESFVPTKFVNHYASTKFAAEQVLSQIVAASSGALTAAILRPRALFGPGDQVLLPRLMKLAEQNNGVLRLPNGGETLLDLTYLDNVVQAMRLADSKAGELPSLDTFNISNGEPVRLKDALTRLFKLLDKPWTIESVPYPVVDVAARGAELAARFTGKEPSLTRYSAGALAFSLTLDISHARNVLGYTPLVSLDEGLRRTAAALIVEQR